MPTIIDHPELGEIEFPDGMSQEDMLKAIDEHSNKGYETASPEDMAIPEGQADYLAAEKARRQWEQWNPLHAAGVIAKEFIGKPLTALSKWTGNTGLGLAEDIGTGRIIGGSDPLKATMEAMAGRTPEAPTTEQGFSLPAEIAHGTIKGAGEMVPAIAATSVGIPPWLAYGTTMGAPPLAEGDFAGAATQFGVGAMLPGILKAGAGPGGRVAANVAERLGVPEAARGLVKGAGEFVGSQLAMNAVMDLAQAPELIDLYKTDPEKFVATLARTAGVNAAFSFAHLPATVKGALMKRAMAKADAARGGQKPTIDVESKVEAAKPEGALPLESYKGEAPEGVPITVKRADGTTHEAWLSKIQPPGKYTGEVRHVVMAKASGESGNVELSHGVLGPGDVIIEGPKTPEELTAAKKGETNARSLGKTEEIHGDVQPQPIEGKQEMPAKEDRGGIQPREESPGASPEANKEEVLRLRDEADRVKALTSAKDLPSKEGSMQEAAYALGDSAKTKEDVQHLVKLKADDLAKIEALFQESKTADPARKEAIGHELEVPMNRSQYYGEAIERATGSTPKKVEYWKGRGEKDYKPPVPMTAEEVAALKEQAPAETPKEVNPPVPVEAAKAPIEKAQAKVTEVATEESPRDAAAIKDDLIAEIQEKLTKAPAEAKPGEKVTIEIPDDGTFTVPNTVEAISGLLERAKKLKTDAGKGLGVPKQAIKNSAKAISQMTGETAKVAKAKEELKNRDEQAEPSGKLYAGFPGLDPELIKRAADALGIPMPGPAFASAVQWARGVPHNARVFMAQLAGRAAPRTSTLSQNSGNALVHYASAKIAAPHVAKAMATEVLGDHHRDPAFGAKLGAVLVEDRLRAIRDGLQQAGDPAAGGVETIIGKQWSPLSTEADFQAALADPEIQQAIQRHKDTVQTMAEEAHEQSGGALAGPGLNTGAFVNLKAIGEHLPPETPRGGAGRGNLENPLKRMSRFFRQARGTAAKYEIDYRTLAQRMVEGNFEESAKRTMYDQLVADGLAEIAAPGDPRPTFGGKPAIKFTVDRRGIPAGEGRARTYIQNLWVDPRIAGELRQAINTDGAVGHGALIAMANLLNRIQLAGPTDAVWHTANMLGSIAGSQGGRNVLIDLARKLPGVNIADALGRVTASGIRVLRDSPEIQTQLAELANIGALRGEHKANVLGQAIQFIDKAGRLVRDDMYRNLVERGLVPDNEATRRDWVNQMGQYNGRLMGQFQRFFKEAGFSPFIVAGRNFNRMAMRRLTMSPGIEASSPAAAMQMRGVEALGTIATLIAIPAFINYFTTGKAAGRPGIKQGQIDLGTDDEHGNHNVIDPAQWTGLRRGLRISGLQAVLDAKQKDQSTKATVQKAAQDIFGGLVHPWTGPAVTAATVAKTGYSPVGYKESVNPKDYGENVKAALKNLNPTIAAAITTQEKDTSFKGELGKSLGGAFGFKTARGVSIGEQMRNRANNFVEQHKLKPDPEWDLSPTATSYFQQVYQAIDQNRPQEAARLFEKLRTQHEDKQIIADILKHAKAPMTGSKDNEVLFVRSLSPKDRELYKASLAERAQQFKKLAEIWKSLPKRTEETDRMKGIRELVRPSASSS